MSGIEHMSRYPANFKTVGLSKQQLHTNMQVHTHGVQKNGGITEKHKEGTKSLKNDSYRAAGVQNADVKKK